MRVHVLEREQRLPIPLAQAWEFFATPRNLARITPSDMGFHLLSDPPEQMYPGLRITYRVRPLLRVPVTWVTEITEVEAPHRFADEQRRGPYRLWRHEHRFREIPGGVEMHDLVRYALPFGAGWVHPLLVAPRLDHIFDYRRKTLEEMFGPFREPSASV